MESIERYTEDMDEVSFLADSLVQDAVIRNVFLNGVILGMTRYASGIKDGCALPQHLYPKQAGWGNAHRIS